MNSEYSYLMSDRPGGLDMGEWRESSHQTSLRVLFKCCHPSSGDYRADISSQEIDNGPSIVNLINFIIIPDLLWGCLQKMAQVFCCSRVISFGA